MTSVIEWFTLRAWTPFAFQREVWDAYRNGESGLVHAATGTGKTLAVWGAALSEWIAGHAVTEPASPNGKRHRRD